MRRVAPNRLSLIFDESEWNNCFIILQGLNCNFTISITVSITISITISIVNLQFLLQGLNSQTLLFGYFQYFSILFMFLSSLLRPIIFSKIYIFNHFKF
jgi:hypothetical protein